MLFQKSIMEQQLSLNFNIPNSLKTILNKIIEQGGVPILVGGMVRDYFLDKESKDYDIEIYQIKSIEKLTSILIEFGDVNLVGVSFGIVKLSIDGFQIDFSFPRSENKSGIGHRGFEINIDSNLLYCDAAKRRDFTVNSIGYDFKNNKILDPYNGIEDINNKILKYVDKNSFIEDPLRVYRAVQFCARLNFQLDENTKLLCKKMVNYDEFKLLSKERIFQEYKKLLLKSEKPSIGMSLLREFKLISYNNDLLVNIDNMVIFRFNNIRDDLVLMFYFIFDILEKISDDKKLIKDIKMLKKFEVPKLYLYKIESIKNKAELISKKLNIMRNMPLPLITGKDLITLGFKPGVEFKCIIDKIYQLQLDGEIISKEDAICYINRM